MPYTELKGSRNFTINDNNISQTMIFHICGETMIESDITFGVFWQPNDDIALARYVFNNFPDFRVFITPTGDPITLFISEFRAEDGKSYGEYTIYLTYNLPEEEQLNAIDYVKFGFDTSGGTETYLKAISTKSAVSRIGSIVLPPNTFGTVRASLDKIEGGDRVTSLLKFNITSYFTPDAWNTGVLLLLSNMTGTYNDALFYGFSPGEVLFEHADAQGENFKLIPISFHFIQKSNGNGIADLPFPPLFALGHDEIDYSYANVIDQNLPIRTPHFRYVHQKYYPSNFALLGI